MINHQGALRHLLLFGFTVKEFFQCDLVKLVDGYPVVKGVFSRPFVQFIGYVAEGEGFHGLLLWMILLEAKFRCVICSVCIHIHNKFHKPKSSPNNAARMTICDISRT